MTLDRSVAPAINPVTGIEIPKASAITLANGLSAYVINAGQDEVVKMEVIIPTGASDGKSYMLATAAHYLSDSGTRSKTAAEIAEGFDYYGSFYQSEISADFRSYTLYSINRFFADSLPLFMEVILEPVFPSHEVENWKMRSLQSLSVNREKVAWLSRTAFSKALYGSDHPYGFTASESDYDYLSSESLNAFYYRTNPLHQAIIILSGKIDDQILKDAGMILPSPGKTDSTIAPVPSPAGMSSQKSKIHIAKENAVQCGIRIGKRMVSKTDPDYLPMTIVNTILGGYFGSRLMSNIREDKGYTYGIGSGITPYINAGSFVIATEVGKDVCNKAVDEIYFELNRLITEPVPEQELDLVKKYLTGVFLRNLDGPFQIADRFKGLKLFGLDYDFLTSYLELLNSFEPSDVMEQASKHLRPETMTEVIAG